MECGSPFLVALPALSQQIVDLARTQHRPVEHQRRQAGTRLIIGGVVPALAVVDDLVVAERWQWRLVRERQDLPRRHAERPHVTLRRETTLEASTQISK